MKIGIAVLAVMVLGLLAVSGLLLLDDVKVRQQLGHERNRINTEAMTTQALTSNQLVEARAEIVRLNNEITFPIHITQKKAGTGPGYFVQILNSSDQPIPVSVTYSNAMTRKSKTFDFQLSPGFSRDIGRLDGWNAVVGDSLQVACPGYLPLNRVLR